MFRGGEFIPNKTLRLATPAQKALLMRTRPNARNPFPGSPRPSGVPGATILPTGSKIPPPIKNPLRTTNPDPKNRAPGTMKGVSFVSNETREGLGLSEAKMAVLRKRQEAFVRYAAVIDAKLGHKSSIDSGVGYWAPVGEKPGAEPTTITEYQTGRDFDDIVYATAAKAFHGNQLSALAFGSDPDGPSVLWSMMVAADLSGIGDTLSRHGIEYRTLKLSNGGKTHILLYDADGSMDDKVKAAAKDLGTEPAFRRGHGLFLGGNAKTRPAARKWYRSYMRTYEGAYPDRPHWP